MTEIAGFLQCTTLQVKQLIPVSVDKVLSKYSQGALCWNSEYGAINFVWCNISLICGTLIPSLEMLHAVNIYC